jgi:hypothetical protein
MSYVIPVKQLGGEVIPLFVWDLYVEEHSIMDDDGFGYPVRDGLADDRVWIKPSLKVPSDATHVIWFNK